MGVGTALGWYIAGYPAQAVSTSIAVFVVACPCALGLATPMAIIAGVGRAAKAGVLIRSSRALEKAGNTTSVVFDKTGTITVGKPAVTDVTIFHSAALASILAVEAASEHPLAGAILWWAKKKNIQAEGTPEKITAFPGFGITGVIDGKTVTIGTHAFLAEKNIPIVQNKQWKGKTIVYGAMDKKCAVVFSIDDQVRPEAQQTVAQLRSVHIRSVLLSGDKKTAAETKARAVGIGKIFADVRPDAKAEIIKNMRTDKSTIMMIGDGINDAPALAAADVGVAIGSGTAIAKATADMTILANNLNRIPFMISLSKRVMQTIRQNLFWAFGYNIVLIPIAMGIGLHWGLTLTPPLAACAMAASSLSVVFNSLRLSRLKMT